MSRGGCLGVLTTLSLAAAVAGCNASAAPAGDAAGDTGGLTQSAFGPLLWADPATGCEYLIYTNGYGAGITPRMGTQARHVKWMAQTAEAGVTYGHRGCQ